MSTLRGAVQSGSFSKLYVYSIKKLDSLYKDNTNSDEGIWKKYIKGSNPEILFNDIYGKGTGWCTAGGIETAKEHINGGDFYVYYTKDKDGNYTNPRIAIRMYDNSIAEIRGIAENQNLESNMEKIVEEKLEGFPDKDTYKKKVNDMKMMTYIYTKFQNKVELTKEDLRFLYEIDNEIIGFGYRKDPRIKEIINARNNERQDLEIIFSCKKEAIALFSYEALSGNIRYCRCDLDLGSLTSAEGLELPIQIGGNLDLKGLKSAEGLKLPIKIGGYLDLSGLKSAEGLELPSQIGNSLFLSGLTNAEGLELPDQIVGSLYLKGLKSAEGLKLPSQIGGNLYLSGLTSAEGLKLPSQIGGDLYLSRLKSVEGLELPSQIGGHLGLFSLTSAEGLMLPKSIGRTFCCPLFKNDLEYAKEYLKNQEEINRPKKI